MGKAKERISVNASNIDNKIRAYLEFRGPVNNHLKIIESVKPPLGIIALVDFFESIKRQEIKGWPTDEKGVSLFEAANRILSDLILFFGVRGMLKRPKRLGKDISRMTFELNLGVRGGPDFRAPAGSNKCIVVGEAFNVATSFFATKMNYELKKICDWDYVYRRAKYKIVMFNEEGGTERKYEEKYPQILFFPVDLKTSLETFL